jgi:hypothetical protein
MGWQFRGSPGTANLWALETGDRGPQGDETYRICPFWEPKKTLEGGTAFRQVGSTVAGDKQHL